MIYFEGSPPPEDKHFYDEDGVEIRLGDTIRGYADGWTVSGRVAAIKDSRTRVLFGVVVEDPERFSGHALDGVLRDEEERGRGWWVGQEIYATVEVNVSDSDFESFLFE